MPSLISRWTNTSVLHFSHGRDPVEAITGRARTVALQALDAGWSGPPFDPVALAEILRIDVVARDDIPEARTVWGEKGRFLIEFNPSRSNGRIRFNLAHEIAHTLFPDCAALVRHRGTHEGMKGDDWQLESLCNIAAAELLMPVANFPSLSPKDYDIERVLKLREEYQVSTEAVLIRLVRLAAFPCAAFVASRHESASGDSRYHLDYIVTSPRWSVKIARGTVVPTASCVSACTAIGYTSRAIEDWKTGDGRLAVECVGIPPYPSLRYPRVAGLLTVAGGSRKSSRCVEFLRGDALHPRGKGPRIIAHVVNDRTANWGGGGFAQAVAREWPDVQQSFRRVTSKDRRALTLGRTHFESVDNEVDIAHMVAQKGYGPSASPRIRYEALRRCLAELAEYASRRGASVHMPLIGTGQGGGVWPIIEELILETLCALEVPVTVYSLPSAPAGIGFDALSHAGAD